LNFDMADYLLQREAFCQREADAVARTVERKQAQKKDVRGATALHDHWTKRVLVWRQRREQLHAPTAETQKERVS
jgi:hypothetical protein